MVFALLSDRFQPTPNLEVPGSRPNPRVQIFPPEYLSVERWFLWNFCLFSYVTEQKPGGGATGHAKGAGRRPDPTFDDYTQNSSDLQS
jgi:hypothetical protein